MAYAHIPNLYKAREILLFKEVFALEKIHGTSAHIAWTARPTFAAGGVVRFFAGGIDHARFVALFDTDALAAKFREIGQDDVTVYGEAYGGKCQGMGKTYGPDLRFVVFDVKIDASWLAVPQAEDIAEHLGLEFVEYCKVSTDIASLDAARDADSVQALRNGMGAGHLREGIVLRPLVEVRMNNGERIIAKHKSDAFAERLHQPKIGKEPTEQMTEARAIADEWVTPMRLTHVLDKMPPETGIEQTGDVIRAMLEDVLREAAGEIEDTKDVRKAVGQAAARMFKARLQGALRVSAEMEEASREPHKDRMGG